MDGIRTEETPLRLLALDGGVRGVSELVILHELMLRIQKHDCLQTVPKPCEIFDMIGGTGTGGLVGIMLGRLRMSVEQAINEWTIQGDQFGERVTQRYLGETDPDAKLFEPGDKCKDRFVVAKDAYDLAGPAQLYLSYSTGNGLDISITEAARATSAAPTFFKSQRMNHPGHKSEFVDGAMGANNPTKLLVHEARRVFPPNRGVSCIVSIGTGKKGISDVKPPSLPQRVLFPSLSINTASAVKDIATTCEAVAEELERRFACVPGLYYRFNVEQGLQEIPLHAYKELGKIKARTIQYLHEYRSEESVKRAALFLSNGVVDNASVESLA